MHPRQRLIEVFSTFIEFQADCFSRWVVDLKLHRNFEKHHAQLLHKPLSESDWLQYWYTRWQTQAEEQALGHLSAYLQESCYWSARKTLRFLHHTPYQLSDCFQLASAETHKVLASYNPQRGASLKGYAQFTYASLIRDTLRQRQEADVCTDWTLLRRVSKQRLLETLHQVGLSVSEITQYRLAWVCYRTLYSTAKAPTRKMRVPTQDQWCAIAKLYNHERHTQLSAPGPVLTPNQLEKRLLQCVAWIREYTYPTIISLQTPSQNGRELYDNLTTCRQSCLLDINIEWEDHQHRQIQQDQLSTMLVSTIGQLAPETQTLLALYYHKGLTQQQIGQQLKLRQSTVSRRLSRTRETLLSALTRWGQNTLHISPTPDLVVRMSFALEDWLTMHYCRQY